jgi:hypothetical protein
MAEETTRQFINRRKRELTFQISALRGQLGSKGEELAELNRTEAALTIAGSAPTPAPNDPLLAAIGGSELPNSYSEPLQKFLDQPALTIKEMILEGLTHHFRDGATPSELRDYTQFAHRRDVDRNSISRSPKPTRR